MKQHSVLEGARILLVGGNEVIRALALALSGDEDLAVTVASNGAQALDLLARERFDAVRMDCQMPGMDGLAATRAKVFEAGMNDHISKPIHVETLLATLARRVRGCR